MNSIEIILKNYKNGNLTLDESVQLLRDINKYPYYYPYYYSTDKGSESVPLEFTTTCKNVPVEFTTYYSYD